MGWFTLNLSACKAKPQGEALLKWGSSWVLPCILKITVGDFTRCKAQLVDFCDVVGKHFIAQNFVFVNGRYFKKISDHFCGHLVFFKHSLLFFNFFSCDSREGMYCVSQEKKSNWCYARKLLSMGFIKIRCVSTLLLFW
jgi:hypothetical protein